MKHLFICEMSRGSYFVYNMIVVKVLFCLMTHLTHFYLRLYGVGHMVKDHSDSERGNPLPTLHGLLFFISSKGLLYVSSHQCSTTGVTKPMVCLSCLWDGACKRTLAANRKE